MAARLVAYSVSVIPVVQVLQTHEANASQTPTKIPTLVVIQRPIMRRIHDMGEDATLDNIQGAWDSFSDGKTHRRNIRSYERNLQRNLERVLDELKRRRGSLLLI